MARKQMHIHELLEALDTSVRRSSFRERGTFAAYIEPRRLLRWLQSIRMETRDVANPSTWTAETRASGRIRKSEPSMFGLSLSQGCGWPRPRT